MAGDKKYEVGQHVFIRSVNKAMNVEGTVAKVGRSLVYVQGPWGTPTAFERAVANDCNECCNPVPEDDAGPSCGAHILHIECAPWFHCTYCYEIRAEIP